MAVTLSPVGNGFQFFGDNGLPLSGGLLWTYGAGGVTPVFTYSDSTGLIQNSNPIVLDPAGRPPGEIWLTVGQAYKFVLLDAVSSPVGPTLDNLVGIQDFNNITATGNTTLGTTGNSLNVSNGALIVSSGNTAVGGDLSVAGNTALGGNVTDVVTVNAGTVDLANNPTITGTATWASAQAFADITSNTYTPTATNITNATSITLKVATYTRVKDVVAVVVYWSCGTTSTGDTLFRITLPISTTFVAIENCVGTCCRLAATANQSGVVYADVSSTFTQAIIRFQSASTGVADGTAQFMYRII